MKYPKIAAALGWNETPDMTEGIFLQPVEAGKINSDLEAGSAAQQAVIDLAEAKGTITERDNTISALNTTIGDMTTSADTAAQAATNTIARRDQRITELEAQVTELGKGSSGNGTTLTTVADEAKPEKESASGVVAYDSPDHPGNQMADQYTRKKR